MHTLIGGIGASVPSAGFAPDDAAISYSDYCAVTVDSGHARFSRPVADGNGLETTNPAARVRFVTDAAWLTIRLQYTNLIESWFTPYNGVGLVLANGAAVTRFNRASGSAGPVNVYVSLGSTASRTIEVLMPHCASVDFLGIDLPAAATLSAAAARPSTRYVAMGDSITQGFYATELAATWAHILAVAKGYQLVNHGYGGRACVPSDGTVLGGLSPTLASYMIGYNDFGAQLALATFKANFTSFVNNFRAINTTAKLYCITPIYSPNTNTLTLAQYRTQIVDALTALDNPLNVLVDGLSIMTNSVAYLQDGVHPNDAGEALIAAALNSIVII